MKQLFYAIAAVIVLFFAIRLMSKVKDVPPEEESELEHLEENEEDADEQNIKI